MEIEVRYLLDALPPGLREGQRIRQGYVCRDDMAVVRIRERAGACTLTIKGGASGLARVEVETALTAGQFEALWPLSAGRRVEKTRHTLPLGRREAEVDVFAGDLDGLMIVEVEFGEEDPAEAVRAAQAFRADPPDWFGEDVTGRDEWSNAHLAEFGRPG